MPFSVLLPLNMDAILLTLSMRQSVISPRNQSQYGTVFQIPWTFLNDDSLAWPHQGMNLLQNLGFKTAAMALSDQSVSIDDPQLMAEEKLAIILGTEGDGLAASTIADCDYTVRIPMSQGRFFERCDRRCSCFLAVRETLNLYK